VNIEARVEGDIVIIDPRDRLTVETEAEFTATVCRLIDTGYTRLVLNMARVVSMDGSGLGAIARASVAARNGGGELKLVNPTPRIRQLLTITGLLNALRAYDGEAEAVVSFSVTRPALWGGADGMLCGLCAV
jgi:anti-sigma B factor antagonist